MDHTIAQLLVGNSYVIIRLIYVGIVVPEMDRIIAQLLVDNSYAIGFVATAK